MAQVHAPEVSSGERNVSSVNRSSKEDLPTLDAPVSYQNEVCISLCGGGECLSSESAEVRCGFRSPPPDRTRPATP